MSVKLKITTKIYLGFAAVVIICIGLGLYGVSNFMTIRVESSILTDEYVPEVNLLSQLESSILKTMFHMRGYGMTGDEKYYEAGLETLDMVGARMKDSQELLAKSPNLIQLGSALETMQSGLKKYRQSVDETKLNQGQVAKGRAERNAAADEANKNASAFLESQYEMAFKEIASGAAKDVLAERLTKIVKMNEAYSLVNESQVGAWRAQATQNPDEYRKVLENLPKILNLLKDIRTTTRKDVNLRQLDLMEASVSTYSAKLQMALENLQTMMELNQKRQAAGEEVIETIGKTTRAGFEGALKVANNTISVVRSSITMFSIGLVAASIGACLIAFLICSGIGRTLRTIIEKLKDSSQQVTESATQLSSAAQQLSGASNEQASSIEETSSSLEEISGMIENNVGNAEQSFRLSSEVMSVSETANESMRKLEISIKEILASNEKIEQLVKVIGNIGEKTKVMDEIVFQTKLLSFNASVEAERAGEHGRGFAVVAQEVGNLAQMSGKSAQEIAEIVKSSIHEAEAITNENRKKVDQGNQYVEESAKGLKLIMESAKTVSSGSNQVLQASKDQAAGIKQVSAAMTELDNATQQNAATAEETAASSEELSAQAEVLNSIVEDLYVLVEGHAIQTQTMVHNVSGHKPAGKHQGKVVQLVPRKKINRSPSTQLKKAAGSDVDPGSTDNRGDESWEKL